MSSFSARFRAHIRSNLVGYVALWVALGGVAWAGATIGAGDIKDNAVHSNHIKNGQVKSADLASGAVGSTEVQDGSLGLADVDSSQLQARISSCGAGSAIQSVDSAGTPSCVQAGGSLTSDFDLISVCDPTSSTYIDCTPSDAAGAMTLSLQSTGNVLLNIGYRYYVPNYDDPASATDAAGRIDAVCEPRIDGSPISPAATEALSSIDSGGADAGTREGVAWTWVAGPLSAGSHTLTLWCKETDGDFRLESTTWSAVGLVSG